MPVHDFSVSDVVLLLMMVEMVVMVMVVVMVEPHLPSYAQ